MLVRECSNKHTAKSNKILCDNTRSSANIVPCQTPPAEATASNIKMCSTEVSGVYLLCVFVCVTRRVRVRVWCRRVILQLIKNTKYVAPHLRHRRTHVDVEISTARWQKPGNYRDVIN